nr:S1 RNA-binding domain-containing protein [Candidatus Microthrix sp.]
MINSIQGETGADISVDDDGMVGIVSVSAVDGNAVAEAERQIRLILDPPTPEVNAEYTGKVVSITKFGAFINILPGRDGLLHISKIGGGKRIDKVEDVLGATGPRRVRRGHRPQRQGVVAHGRRRQGRFRQHELRLRKPG